MNNLPGLVVDVEARIDKLEKGMARAAKAQARGSNQMERRAQRSAKSLERTYDRAGSNITAVFKKLGPSLIAGLGIGALSGLAQEVRGVVRATAEIGDEAKRAGVSIEAFQELKYVSEQNRVGVDAMVDELKEMSIRADEFIVTGKGAGAEAFARLNLNAAQLAEGLKKPDQLFLDIVGRLEDLDDAARIRVADEIFGGTGGEQFVQLIGQGEDALRATIQAGRDAGAVLDAELIRKAEELDRRFQALQTRVSNFGKALAVGLADASVKVVTLRTDLDDLFRSYEQAQGLLGEGTTDALAGDPAALAQHEAAVAAIRREYEVLNDEAAGLAGPLFQTAATLAMYDDSGAAGALNSIATEMTELAGKMDRGEVAAEEFELRMADLAAQAQTALSEVTSIDSATFGSVTAALNGFIGRLGAAVARARELRAALPGANEGGVSDTAAANGGVVYDDLPSLPPVPSRLAPGTSKRPERPGVDSFPDISPKAATGGGGAGVGGAAKQSDYEREIEAIARETAELQMQAAELAKLTGANIALGDAEEFAKTKAELLSAAQRSGLQITPQLDAKIDELARGYVDAGLAADQASDRIRKIQEASKAGANSIAGVFEQMATGAITAKQAVGQLIKELVLMALKKKLLSVLGAATGPLGQIVSLVGGGFADGGYTGDGGKNEPAGVVHRGEYVLSKSATNAIGVPNLDALHSAARRGYSGGGLVGPARKAMSASSGSNSASQPAINISAPVTVNGSSGTPDQNADLARRTAKAMENSMRTVVQSELVRQMRPGNMLNRGAS